MSRDGVKACGGEEMTLRIVCGTFGLVLALAVGTLAQQASGVSSVEATGFIGTWAILMVEPSGAHETIRIWDNNGTLAATVQSEQSPPIKVTGMIKDRNVLFLTATRYENGQPIWAVIALKLNGDGMNMHQMLEPSWRIKLGSGKRQ
jgi:hypothetical protein